MNLTLVNKTSTTAVEQAEVQWAEVVEYLTTFSTCTEDERAEHSLFTGWEMKPPDEAEWTEHDGGYRHYSRSKKNCVALSFLTLDIDNDPKKGLPYWTFDAAMKDLAGLEAVFYSSFNHLNPAKHGGVHKFRVVLPLAFPMPLKDYEERVNALRAEFPSAASESFTPSQPYWPPLQEPTRTEFTRFAYIKGEFMDWSMLERNATIDAAVRAIHNGVSAQSTTTDENQRELTSTKKVTKTALDWYNSMNDGYEHRVPCFSCVRAENNPTAFFYRDGCFLKHYDKGLEEWLYIRCSSPLTELKLVRKKKTPAENLELPSVRPGKHTLKWQEPEEDPFIPPLSQTERALKLATIPRQLVDVNVLLAPEGYGKSYLVKILADLGFKVLFACASNEQADKKFEEFSQWSAFEIRRPISKAHNLFLKTGVKQQNLERDWEIGLPVIDKIKTAQAAGEAEFDQFYTEHKAAFVKNWHEADILCTTFTLATNILSRGLLGNTMKQVVVVVDDPADTDFFNKYYVSVEQFAKLNDGKLKLPDGLKLTRYEGHDLFELDQTTFPFCNIKPYHHLGRLRLPKLLFTTTELLTEATICAKFKDVKVFNLMHNIDAGQITLLGTKLVRHQTKPFLIGMTDAISKRTKILQTGPFGNGLKDYRSPEENLNHVNLKGRNDFRGNNVVVLNKLHPHQGANLFINITGGLSGSVLELISLLDKFHQSMRNAGYRYEGAETIVLCDPTLWDFIAENTRYKFSPHSCHFADYPTNHHQFLDFKKHLIATYPLDPPSQLVAQWKYFLACWPKLIADDLTLLQDLSACKGCASVVEEVRQAAGAKWIDVEEYFDQEGTRKRAVVRSRRLEFGTLEQKAFDREVNRKKKERYFAKKRAAAKVTA